ncbi:MAG: alanine--tRNA ligase [Planctomycetota bacterium]
MSLTPDQIRETYLSFFAARGHTRCASDGLVPQNDPTLLFTGAGMNQFKAMFLGKGQLPYTRATTTQKCLRMPDLDNVGRTPSHHTFFEMLGNFSFGDYFKREAIGWAWELLTGPYGLPPERLSVTVFHEDDEAAAIWRDEIRLPAGRIYRRGEEDNFWPASAPSKGPNGICGPCSEIYFDFYPERGPYPEGGPSTDGRRFLEIWNLVFTQFERQDGGVLTPLPRRNIDTGMGFERLVRVLQTVATGQVVSSNFETPLFEPLIEAIHGHIGRVTAFGTPEGTRVRRIADHVRAASFCIADGVRPSNERQGYVVRKILRRAMLDRHVLGSELREPWLANLSGLVAQSMGGAWPELREASAMVASTIAAEEEKFAGAFLAGSQRLAVLAEETRRTGQKRLDGASAFLLYDTFGLPVDLQRLLLEEQGLDVDEEGYRAAMAEQRRRSREASKLSDKIFDEGPLAGVSAQIPPTSFVRDALEVAGARLLAVVDEPRADAGESAADAQERRVVLILDRTPFYAEGGGQAGDAGTIGNDNFLVEVDDTVVLRGIFLHRGVVISGDPAQGTVRAAVDPGLRSATARNHTGTHLLHAALRFVLGSDVTQAGSLVSPDRLRFDFRFPRALTAEETSAIERLVNEWILTNAAVEHAEMSRDEARQQGAMALFGEKYGDVVRVVRVPGLAAGRDSVELCGGTHVQRSGDIGLLRVLSEASIAAGIRRIEARTGLGVLELLRAQEHTLRAASALLKTAPERLEERIEASQEELKGLRRELEDLRSRMATTRLEAAQRPWDGLSVLVAAVEGLPVKTLRELSGRFLDRGADLVMIAVPEEATTSFLVSTGKSAQARGLSASVLVASLAESLGGKGGGSAAFAQGKGGPPPADLEAVLQRVLDASSQVRN